MKKVVKDNLSCNKVRTKFLGLQAWDVRDGSKGRYCPKGRERGMLLAVDDSARNRNSPMKVPNPRRRRLLGISC